MTPDEGYQETSAFLTWMGQDGICRTVVKEGVEITIVEAKENSKIVQSYDDKEHFPMVVDTRKIRSMTKEARDFFSLRDRPSPVNAIAIIVGSSISRVIGNFFIGLNKQSVPNRLFDNEEDALEWASKWIET